MRLYEFGPTRSIRARWTLQELGVDFESVEVDLPKGEHRHPDFLKLNPAAKIPVLVDGNLVVTESIAIVLYLAEKYADKGLLPADLAERSQAYRWLLFVTTELEQPLWRMARHERLYPETDRLPADIDLARRDFTELAPVLEEHMKGREFVVGDRVGVVDFVTAYTLDWANEVGLLEGFPTLRAYMERMLARPKAPPRIRETFTALQR
ncbi:MAG TPA: glutathione S-transferase family protein [Myxococcota bacterium]|nr:glutathione S-transferase family protein [Myxococcota bacterium]